MSPRIPLRANSNALQKCRKIQRSGKLSNEPKRQPRPNLRGTSSKPLSKLSEQANRSTTCTPTGNPALRADGLAVLRRNNKQELQTPFCAALEAAPGYWAEGKTRIISRPGLDGTEGHHAKYHPARDPLRHDIYKKDGNEFIHLNAVHIGVLGLCHCLLGLGLISRIQDLLEDLHNLRNSRTVLS